MVAFAALAFHHMDNRSLPVGVFEDDALLLQLIERSRSSAAVAPQRCSPLDGYDLDPVFSVLVESRAWEM